jgi:hypothetical protein
MDPMTESDLLERLDRHLARGDQIAAEHRDFIREMTERQERVTNQLVDQIAASTAQIEANTARVQAGTEQLRDLNLATKQHTQAIARMLDRLG